MNLAVLEHIFDWVWVQNCVPDFTVEVFFFARKTTFYLQMLDTNDTQKYYCFQFVKQNFKNLRCGFWADANLRRNGTKIILYFFVTSSRSFEKEHWLGTRRIMPKINKIWSVNNPIQTAAFLETCRDFVLYWPKLFDF